MLLFFPFTEETGINVNTYFHKCLMLQGSCKSLIKRINVGTTFFVNTLIQEIFCPRQKPRQCHFLFTAPIAPALSPSSQEEMCACLPSCFASADLMFQS